MSKDQEPQSSLRGVKCRYLRVKPHFNEPTTFSCVLGNVTGPPGKEPSKCYYKSGRPCMDYKPGRGKSLEGQLERRALAEMETETERRESNRTR